MVLDVASNRKILQALLTNIGVQEVDTAQDGREAVQAALAEPQKYDIILMDNIMPVMVPLDLDHDISDSLFHCSISVMSDCYYY